MEQKRKKIG